MGDPHSAVGSAQIAFMNPGGLRADLIGSSDTNPRDVTYRQAADVQPFANELTNKQMTGAQIRAVLEQQWQRDVSGNVPSRPFLRLGTSSGFTYTYTEAPDPAHPGANLGHVTAMYLNGVKLDDATTYSVTMNSFLASGGDNFTAFLQGTNEKDTGLTDLQAQVDYMTANATAASPLPVDFAQHAVKVTFPGGAPAAYLPGDTVAFDVASLAMTAVGDVQDDSIDVVLDGEVLGTFPVDNTMTPNQPYDETGKASVSVTLPVSASDGTARLHLVGHDTGTDVIVAIPVDDGLPDTTVSAPSTTVPIGQDAHVAVTVNKSDAGGTVEVRDGATLLGTGTVTNGSATVTILANQLPAIGAHQLTLDYSGDPGKYSPSTGTFTLTVDKATPTITAPDVTVPVGQTGTETVTVTAVRGQPDRHGHAQEQRHGARHQDPEQRLGAVQPAGAARRNRPDRGLLGRRQREDGYDHLHRPQGRQGHADADGGGRDRRVRQGHVGHGQRDRRGAGNGHRDDQERRDHDRLGSGLRRGGDDHPSGPVAAGGLGHAVRDVLR